MQINDLVLIGVTESLKRLSIENDTFFTTWKKEGHFNTDQLRQNEQRSVGFRFADRSELPLTLAFSEFKKQGLKKVSVAEAIFSQSGLPKEIEAAFANTSSLALCLQLNGSEKSFIVKSQLSPASEFTLKTLVELVQAQPARQQIWKSLTAFVNRYLENHEQPLINVNDLPQYLSQPEQEVTLEPQLTAMLREVQIDARLAKLPFVVPETLKKYLEFVEPFTPPEMCFNSSARVSGQDVIDLLEAQPDQELVQQFMLGRLQDVLENFNNPQNWGEWKKIILSQTEDGVKDFGLKAMDSVMDVFMETNDVPVIPDHVRRIFTPQPPDFEDPRDLARAQFYDEPYWAAKPNESRWEHFELHEITGIKIDKTSLSFDEATKKFNATLDRIRKFAEKVKSPFAEAFRYGQFLLNDASFSKADTNEFSTQILSEMKAKNFSEMALEICERKIWIVPSFTKMGLSIKAIRALGAYASTRNLFGEMGSWNDENFLDEKDQAEYDACSAALYQGLTKFYIATLNL